MATVPEALALAMQYHQVGNLQEAEQLYRQILQVDAQHVDALHLLGLIAQQVGRNDLAIEYISQALRIAPHFAEAHNNLGNALAAQGRPDQAEASYRQALQLKPDYAEAHHNLGIALASQGKRHEAIGSLQQAVRLKPDYAEAHNNLGIALADLGRTHEAIASYQQALYLRPNYAETHNNLGVALKQEGRIDDALVSFRQAILVKPTYAEAHNSLGVALTEIGLLDDAVTCLREAVRLKPGYAEAHSNLGVALTDQRRLDEAVDSLRTAVRLKPEYAEALNNLGIALVQHGKPEEAETTLKQALRLRPDYAEAQNSLGTALNAQGKHQEAVARYEESCRLKPDYAEPRSNLGMVRLLLGNFEEGWPSYEWRSKSKGFAPPRFTDRLWDGSPLDGQTILLHSEQGLGDTLQFIRFATLVHERGGKVMVTCQEPLVRLVGTCPGVDAAAVDGSVVQFDVQASLLSLPAILGTTLATVPAHVPYLDAFPALQRKRRQELDNLPGFKIGIAWQGNPSNRNDAQRSFPLTNFEPLACLDRVQLISLQNGPGADQVRALGGRFQVTDIGSHLNDFMDTAAVVKNLDLVITADTAIAHLAGALGVPVWVALPFAPDWRWMLNRVDSPWYPTMRLFRQRERGNWVEVFERIKVTLESMLPKTPTVRPIRVEITPGDLIDKLTMLEVKCGHLADATEREAARRELAELQGVREQTLKPGDELEKLAAQLRAVNETLWRVNEELHSCEGRGDFGAAFIELARTSLRENDRRAALVRQINECVSSVSHKQH